MDPPCHGYLLHSQRFLHVLGKLRLPHRCHDLHPSRSCSACRLRPQLVGDVPRELGDNRLELVAMDHNWIDCRDVRRHHHAHRHPLWFLRRIRVHHESILYHLQLDPMHHHHVRVHSPRRSRTQPSVWTRPSQHGRRLLHLFDRVCSREPRDRYVQEPY